MYQRNSTLGGETATPNLLPWVDFWAAHSVSSLVQKALAGRYVLLVKGLRYMDAVLMFDLYLCVTMGTFITASFTLHTFL